MIKEKISKLELEYRTNMPHKLNAVLAVKNLLNEIDFSVEIVPTESVEKLTKLLASLKGEQLCNEEVQLVKQIVG